MGRKLEIGTGELDMIEVFCRRLTLRVYMLHKGIILYVHVCICPLTVCACVVDKKEPSKDLKKVLTYVYFGIFTLPW